MQETELKNTRNFLLQGLTIYDGTGLPPISGDILISDGKIAAIEQINSSIIPNDTLKYDCSGLLASPGFIDIHSHSDRGILLHPQAECLIRQGITTSVGGNCGGSAGSAPGEHQFGDVQFRWKDLNGFLRAIEIARPAVNAALLFGHGDVRTQLVGNSGRPLTFQEKRSMIEISRKHMLAGAFGVSSGLEYAPGRFADLDELVAISEPVAGMDGIHAMHLRNEGPDLFESVEEAIKVAGRSNVRFEISHLKSVGETNWGKLPNTLRMLDSAQVKGIDISADVYPYLASSTGLAIVLPDWVLAEGNIGAIKLLQPDSALRDKIAQESDRRTQEQGGWGKIVITSVHNPNDKWMEGLNMNQVAVKLSKPPQNAALDVLLHNKIRVRIIRHAMNENDLVAAMKHPRVCFVTDGTVTVKEDGKTHPRSIGTYPRVLGRYVREKAILPMEEAIRKMTSLPASKMKIYDRGVLKAGLAADIVVFDEETIIDKSSFQNPWQFPEGIHGVFVNGLPAIWEGEVTGIRAGKVLRKT